MPDMIDDSELTMGPCRFCNRLISLLDRTCEPFERIPDEIWSGKNMHQTPISGDNNLVFMPPSGR